MIEIGRGGTKGPIATCARSILHEGGYPWAMGTHIMNHNIGLRVSGMITRRTLVLNSGVLIRILFIRMRIVRMIRCEMMEKGRPLQELRLVHTQFAFMGEILLMLTANMVMHCVLLLLNNLAVGTNKLTIRIFLILRLLGIHCVSILIQGSHQIFPVKEKHP